MEIQRREPYNNNCVMHYKDLKKFFIPELEIRYCKGEEIPKVSDVYNCYRVWLLFAKLEGHEWTCVQVAHSKNDIKKIDDDYIWRLLWNGYLK